jgi:D-arabinose 1-dehydrogenase-like Zn-dependent alcohol dehydrogenase
VRLCKGSGADGRVELEFYGVRKSTPHLKRSKCAGAWGTVQLFGEEISINPARIFFKRAKLLGVGSVSRTQLEDALRLAVLGRVRPRIAKVLSLTEIARAHEMVENAEVSKRVVVVP